MLNRYFSRSAEETEIFGIMIFFYHVLPSQRKRFVTVNIFESKILMNIENFEDLDSE